jgi:hypothetical protein
MTDEERQGVVSSLTALGRTAITVTPPALAILVLLNVAFLFVQWEQNASRERVLMHLVASCIKQ